MIGSRYAPLNGYSEVKLGLPPYNACPGPALAQRAWCLWRGTAVHSEKYKVAWAQATYYFVWGSRRPHLWRYSIWGKGETGLCTRSDTLTLLLLDILGQKLLITDFGARTWIKVNHVCFEHLTDRQSLNLALQVEMRQIFHLPPLEKRAFKRGPKLFPLFHCIVNMRWSDGEWDLLFISRRKLLADLFPFPNSSISTSIFTPLFYYLKLENRPGKTFPKGSFIYHVKAVAEQIH